MNLQKLKNMINAFNINNINLFILQFQKCSKNYNIFRLINLFLKSHFFKFNLKKLILLQLYKYHMFLFNCALNLFFSFVNFTIFC